MNRDELADRLRRSFLEELGEHLEELDAHLVAWEADPADGGRLRSILRAFHTIKGSARVAAVPLVEQAAHAVESLLARIRDGAEAVTPEHFRLLFRASDALGDAAERLRRGEDLAGSLLAGMLAELRQATGGVPGGVRARPAAPARAAPERPAAGGDGGGEPRPRVDPERLDALLAAATELQFEAARLTRLPSRLEALRRVAVTWVADWRRVRAQLPAILDRAGAPAALTAAAAGMEDRLGSLERRLDRLARTAKRDARDLGRLSGRLGETVRRLRLRPFADACVALPRAARDVAESAGKDVELRLSGQELEADRAVVQRMREPLLHLVRNAVDHGIEAPPERSRRGKPSRGTVEVAAELRGDRLLVRVSDDGAGLDLAALRASLQARGVESPAADADLVRGLFSGGLTVRAEPTAVSGRGVGLDVVRAAADELGGTVDVAWRDGEGTTFTLDVPTTAATVTAVIVRVGPHLCALPASHVGRLVRIEQDRLHSVEGRPMLTVEDGDGTGAAPVAHLADILGPPHAPGNVAAGAPAVLLRRGDRRLALVVDALEATDDVVIRPLDRRRVRTALVSAGALLPSGRVALVLPPAALIEAALAVGRPGPPGAPRPARPAPRRILVVDDSITTRTLERSVLEAAGYEVLTAADGEDGWRVLQQEGADLVVADVDMPRMDGFALAETIRASERFRQVPIVMVTALETPEDRLRGMEVGADAYIGKSAFDQEALLDTIRQLLGNEA